MTKINGRKLDTFSGDSFYGVPLTSLFIEGLAVELRHGKRNGRDYSYIVYTDGESIKWRIEPLSITENKKLHGLKLMHRNRYGRSGFHTQTREWATPRGLRALLAAIREHESYELQQG